MVEYSYASVATLSRLAVEIRPIQMAFLQEIVVSEWDLCLQDWVPQCTLHLTEDDGVEVAAAWVAVEVE